MISRDETNQFPKRLSKKKIIYKDFNRSIYRVIANFDGFQKEYFVSKYGTRAALLVENKKKILLSRQYRLMINNLSFEIPGGKVEKNETGKKAAKRECFEETGVKVIGIKKLIDFHQGLDVHDSLTKVYFSTNVIDDQKLNGRVWLPINKCLEMISSGEIVDNLSIIAILSHYNKINQKI